MSTPLELAEKLLARATRSSFPEECRTSAEMLARLIEREGLVIVDPRDIPKPKPVSEPARRVILTSKYRGRCAECGCRYFPGDEIAWMKGYDTICIDCWEASR